MAVDKIEKQAQIEPKPFSGILNASVRSKIQNKYKTGKQHTKHLDFSYTSDPISYYWAKTGTTKPQAKAGKTSIGMPSITVGWAYLS